MSPKEVLPPQNALVAEAARRGDDGRSFCMFGVTVEELVDGDGDGYGTGWWQCWGLGPVCASLFEGADFLPQRSVLGLAGTELGSTFCNVSLECRYVLWVCFHQLCWSQKGDYLTLAVHSEVTSADFVRS